MSQAEALLVERATSVLGFEVLDLLEDGFTTLDDLRKAVRLHRMHRESCARLQHREDRSCNKCNAAPPCTVRVEGLDSAALARVAAILAEEV